MLRCVAPGMMCGCGVVDMACCERKELNCEAVKVHSDAVEVDEDIRMSTTAPLGELTQHPPHGETVVEGLLGFIGDPERPGVPTDEAVKFDQGKPRFDLMPPDALSEIAKVFTMGAEKYAPRNWEKGTNWGRANAAMLRHIMAWMACEDDDPESGLNHMAHVAWGAMCLLAYQMRGVGQDDRYRPEQVEMDFSAAKEGQDADVNI